MAKQIKGEAVSESDCMSGILLDPKYADISNFDLECMFFDEEHAPREHNRIRREIQRRYARSKFFSDMLG
jgi:hypothetical protein